MTEQINVSQLAKELAHQLNRSAYLVTPADIAAMMGYSANSTAMRQLLADPSFPRYVELTEGGRRRYRRKDVEAWIDARFERLDRAALAALAA